MVRVYTGKNVYRQLSEAEMQVAKRSALQGNLSCTPLLVHFVYHTERCRDE
jgi:hypothetical protein